MNDKNESMKPTPCFLFLLASAMYAGCAPVKQHQAINSDPYGKSLKYRPVDYTTRTVSAEIKDEDNNRAVISATVELYLSNTDTEPLFIKTTNTSGRVQFSLKDGSYILTIKSRDYELKEVPFDVAKWDVNLGDIKLRPIP